MTELELIGEQALKIATLEEEARQRYEAISAVTNHIYCIGGLLDENAFKYTESQRKGIEVIGELLEI